MIDDWCYLEDGDNKEIHQVTVNDFIKKDFDNLTPITLTIDILTKNEFHEYHYSENESAYTIFEYGDMLLPIAVREVNNEWRDNVYLGDHYFEYGPIINGEFCELGTIRYVHELQHLLKSLNFGINFVI